MKAKVLLLLLLLFVSVNNLSAADVTTVDAKSSNIGENLDLEAVASVFGEAKDLEDFEKKLNDPEAKITNLDLNEDGKVDYLRVTESSKGNTKLVTIQAVIGKDQYQDVATIDVEKDSKGETQVQVVGDVYMYGPGYIIEPVYVHPPVIYLFFWTAVYRPWRSPFYWGVYPPYYRPWRPYPRGRYRTNVRVNVNVNNTYNNTTIRKSKTSIELQEKSRRNDFGKKNPDKSFNKRNKKENSKEKVTSKKDTSRKVEKDWKPTSQRGVKNSKSSAVSKKSNNSAGDMKKPTAKRDNLSTQRKKPSKNIRSSNKMGASNREAKKPTKRK